jgi:streptogramin lyase
MLSVAWTGFAPRWEWCLVPDLDEQLRSYFDAIADEIVAETDSSWVLATSDEHNAVVVPTGQDEPSSTMSRNVLLLAAAAVVLIVGLYVVSRSNSDDSAPVFIDEPPTSTPTPTPADLGSAAGILGPGAWTVAASLGEGDLAQSSLADLVEEVSSWPGVIDVREVGDEEAWRTLAGLIADCSDSERSPCASGIVVLTDDSSMGQTALRLQNEFAMTALTPLDVPTDFIEGYVGAAVAFSSPVPLEFDPSTLGVEQPMDGPYRDNEPADSICSGPCVVGVEVNVEGVATSAGLGVFGSDSIVQIDFAGTGYRVDHLLTDRFGRGGVLTGLRSIESGRRVYKFAALPLEAAVITFERSDGTSAWQRPLAGMAVIVDSRDTEAMAELTDDQPVGPFVVLDAAGKEIMRIVNTIDGPLIEDSRLQTPPDADTLARPDASSSSSEVLATLDGANVGRDLVETKDAIWLTASIDEQDFVVRIDTTSGGVDLIPVENPGGLVATADALWVNTLFGRRTLVRIDLESRAVTNTLELPVDPQQPTDIVVGSDGGLWVTAIGPGYIRVDLETFTTDTYASPGVPGGYMLGELDGGLWIRFAGEALTRIDLETRAVERHEFDVGRAKIAQTALAADSIWLSNWDDGPARFDLASRTITHQLSLGGGANGIAYADGAVWLSNGGRGTVTRIDATTAEVTDVITVAPDPRRIRASTDFLWIGHDDGVVSRIDIGSRTLAELISVADGAIVGLLPSADGNVWAASQNGVITRIRVDAQDG